jgi:hypothetical protein
MVYDDGDASMRILRWTSTGSAFTGPATYTSGPFHLSAVGGRIASGDVNGDGKDDIVMAAQNNDGTFSFHVFNGAATWAGRWYTSGPFNLGPVGDRLVVGDFSGDGKADPALVYDDGDASMRIMRWTSTGSAFAGPATYTSGPFHLSAVGGRIASGDVNGDGKDDIVMAAQNNDGTFSFHVFNSAATWAGKWYTSGPFNLGPVGDRLVVGDFNGDGKADVALIYDDGDASMRIMRWTSTGSAFAGPATYTSGPFHLSAVGGRIASGDVNGDGKDDIVMAAQNNDGTFSFHVFNSAATWAGKWYTSGPFNLGPVGDRLTVGAW